MISVCWPLHSLGRVRASFAPGLDPAAGWPLLRGAATLYGSSVPPGHELVVPLLGTRLVCPAWARVRIIARQPCTGRVLKALEGQRLLCLRAALCSAHVGPDVLLVGRGSGCGGFCGYAWLCAMGAVRESVCPCGMRTKMRGVRCLQAGRERRRCSPLRALALTGCRPPAVRSVPQRRVWFQAG